LRRAIKMTPMSQPSAHSSPSAHSPPPAPPPPRQIGPIAWLLPLLWLLLDAAWELSGALPAPEITPRPIPPVVWKGLGWAAAAALLLHLGVYAARALRTWLHTRNAFVTHPYPMCWIDPATRQIVQANHAASVLFGACAEQLRGQPTSRFWEFADESADGPLPASAPVHVLRGDGRLVTMELGCLHGNANNGPGACLVILREHTGYLRAHLASTHRELQALTRRLLHLQEDERRALSRELHDDVGQAITAIKLAAHAALDEDDPMRRREDLAGVMETADQTLIKLRDLATLLRPPQLDALGLEAALRGYANGVFRNVPVGVALDLDIQPLPQRPAPEIEQVCFRIAQESLTNALRHANADRIALSLGDHDGQRLQLRVADNGDGVDPSKGHGLGLVIMRERARSVDGVFEIDTALGGGTRISVLLPYRNNANARAHTPSRADCLADN